MVYLAHDTLLDRDDAFALIKTEGLDEASRTRFIQEAQAVCRAEEAPRFPGASYSCHEVATVIRE